MEDCKGKGSTRDQGALMSCPLRGRGCSCGKEDQRTTRLDAARTPWEADK